MKTIKKVVIKCTQLRLSDETETYNRVFTDSRGVHSVLRAIMGQEDQEVFVALLLDTKNRCIGYKEIARGGMTACVFTPSEVFRPAIMLGAAAIIVSHNHPSGDPDPSDADVAITRKLKQAGELLGINVLDHVILGADRYFSFCDAGRL